jgi:hypothetical protein
MSGMGAEETASTNSRGTQFKRLNSRGSATETKHSVQRSDTPAQDPDYAVGGPAL